MSRRNSRSNPIEYDPLQDFEAFKKQYLTINKHITKINSGLNSKVEELNGQLSCLYVENLQLRTLNVSLSVQLKQEKDRSKKILEESERAVSHLIRHFESIRSSLYVSATSSVADDDDGSPETEQLQLLRPFQPRGLNISNVNGRGQRQRPTTPPPPRISRPPAFDRIHEADSSEEEDRAAALANGRPTSSLSNSTNSRLPRPVLSSVPETFNSSLSPLSPLSPTWSDRGDVPDDWPKKHVGIGGMNGRRLSSLLERSPKSPRSPRPPSPNPGSPVVAQLRMMTRVEEASDEEEDEDEDEDLVEAALREERESEEAEERRLDRILGGGRIGFSGPPIRVPKLDDRPGDIFDGQSSADEALPTPSSSGTSAAGSSAFAKVQVRKRATGLRRVGMLKDVTNATPISTSANASDADNQGASSDTPATGLPTPPPSSEMGDELSSPEPLARTALGSGPQKAGNNTSSSATTVPHTSLAPSAIPHPTRSLTPTGSLAVALGGRNRALSPLPGDEAGTGDESAGGNGGTGPRPSRSRKSVNYAEPSLKKKMRKPSPEYGAGPASMSASMGAASVSVSAISAVSVPPLVPAVSVGPATSVKRKKVPFVPTRRAGAKTTGATDDDTTDGATDADPVYDDPDEEGGGDGDYIPPGASSSTSRGKSGNASGKSGVTSSANGTTVSVRRRSATPTSGVAVQSGRLTPGASGVSGGGTEAPRRHTLAV